MVPERVEASVSGIMSASEFAGLELSAPTQAAVEKWASSLMTEVQARTASRTCLLAATCWAPPRQACPRAEGPRSLVGLARTYLLHLVCKLRCCLQTECSALAHDPPVCFLQIWCWVVYLLAPDGIDSQHRAWSATLLVVWPELAHSLLLCVLPGWAGLAEHGQPCCRLGQDAGVSHPPASSCCTARASCRATARARWDLRPHASWPCRSMLWRATSWRHTLRRMVGPAPLPLSFLGLLL